MKLFARPYLVQRLLATTGRRGQVQACLAMEAQVIPRAAAHLLVGETRCKLTEVDQEIQWG